MVLGLGDSDMEFGFRGEGLVISAKRLMIKDYGLGVRGSLEIGVRG